MIPEWIGKDWASTPRPVGWAEIDGVERGLYPVRPAIHGTDSGYLYTAVDKPVDNPVIKEFWEWEPSKEVE